ncbi:MAG: helix-turn-helix transcriptional regulator [Acidobacteriota bacterium]
MPKLKPLPAPLKPHYFQILLAVSGGDLHGYAIQRAVLDQTDDQMRLWPAMLYRSLARLEAADLLAEAGAPEDHPSDERRRYYTLTEAGRQRLGEEALLMSRWAQAALEAVS